MEYMSYVLLGLLILGGIFFVLSLNYRLRHDNDPMTYLFTAFGFMTYSILCFIMATFVEESNLGQFSLKGIRIAGWVFFAVSGFSAWFARGDRGKDSDKTQTP